MASKDLDKDRYIKDTLEELSELSVSDINRQLDLLEFYSRQSGLCFYPFTETIDTKDGNKKIKLVEKSPKDCVPVAKIIVAKIFSFFSNEAYSFCNNSGDPLDVADLFLYLDKNGTEEEKDEMLERFDSTFSFLENIPSYKSIYTLFRNDYFRLLNKKIKSIYSCREFDKENRTFVKRDWPRGGKR